MLRIQTLLCLIAFVSASSSLHRLRRKLQDAGSTVICSADVFACSDGSYVSRDPLNNCEFSECSSTAIPTVQPTESPVDPLACPNGFTPISSGIYSFCYNDENVDYDTAKANCESNGLQLVEVKSEGKAAALDSIASSNYAWLGLICPSGAEECQTDLSLWQWERSGLSVHQTEGYTNRFKLSANGNIYGGGSNGENCAHWWKRSSGYGIWAPHFCNSGYGTLCEPAYNLNVTYDQTKTTCSNSDRISNPCTGKNGCSYDECAQHCFEESECNFFFSNSKSGCHLYRSCDSTRWADLIGTTVELVRN